MNNYQKNLDEINKQIEQSCQKAGRPRSELRLVAVSKKQSIEKILEFYRLGIQDFAENYAQEFRDKIKDPRLMAIQRKLNWHFVGQLQKNKLKYIVGHCALIHSVNSIQIAEAINHRAQLLGIKQKILLQFNISQEEQKAGFELEFIHSENLQYLKTLKNIQICGLMGMASQLDSQSDSQSNSQAKNTFIKLKDILLEINGREVLPHMTELSMGMSQDFPEAIAAGATLIRIGSALMGTRE